jgi:hypothetical protein
MTNMLVEGQLDNETTALSRVIVSNIKERERSLRREPQVPTFSSFTLKTQAETCRSRERPTDKGFLSWTFTTSRCRQR